MVRTAGPGYLDSSANSTFYLMKIQPVEAGGPHLLPPSIVAFRVSLGDDGRVMPKSKATTPNRRSPAAAALRNRLSAFIAEAYPFALESAIKAWDTVESKVDAGNIDAAAARWAVELRRSIRFPRFGPKLESTPAVPIKARLSAAADRLLEDGLGFFRREAIAASLTDDEKREMLRGMMLTRAADNQLKAFFSGSQIRYGSKSFQGKGFRSLGQEAIYGAALRLRRGEEYRKEGKWTGDVIAPIIRDVGAAIAMHPEPETIRMILNAQMGKAGPPMNGKDLHVGDFDRGIIPASAPLSISTLTATGMAMGFQLEGSDRVAVSFIGEGGSSLGEWHEAINLCAARGLPAIFCLQNNQTALSTPVPDQSVVRVFADKAVGYGIPGITIDGTDPEAIAVAFTWAAERARAGEGPSLIELISMRMCGHAHHDDMLYLGKDPKPSWEYHERNGDGYANAEAYAYWSERDPIATYSSKLVQQGIITKDDFENWKADISAIVEREAEAVVKAPWPGAELAGENRLAGEARVTHVSASAQGAETPGEYTPPLPDLDIGPDFNQKGATFLEAVMLGVGDALESDPRAFVYGQDVGGEYGNAFMLLRPLLKKHGDRILNSTLTEGGIIGVCVGSALAGRRPIGEIQFNDFIATGFNQLVNNAAKIRYRWGGEVPMVLRMPWGGLRSAGPYHSQNTEPWFYRTPGLKIVVPSTPHDARALMASAMADPDPVLYYEHIALYREPSIKQKLGNEPPAPIPLGKAALRRAGSDLSIISYGAFVHTALRVAGRLSGEGVEASVLDLRSLAPLDREALLACARHAGKVVIVHEDSRTGGVGESLAAIIQEEAFEYLDAPIRVIGALDTPVPYSPPLEEAFLPSDEMILDVCRALAAY